MRMGELATHNDLLVQQLRLLLTEGLDHHWIQVWFSCSWL